LRPFEDACASYGTIAKIVAAFEDEGFEVCPDRRGLPDYKPAVTRLGTFDDYVSCVDRTDSAQAQRLLRILETILSWIPETQPALPLESGPIETQESEERIKTLHDDGYALLDDGRIRRTATRPLTELPLDTLRDPEAIEEHLRRLQTTRDTDPGLAISSATALVEATCKHVLEEVGAAYDDKSDVPALVRMVQKALKVHPEEIAPTVKGRNTIVRTLSNAVADQP